MANIKSAKKAIRVTKRRTLANKKVKRTFREIRKEILKTFARGDIDKAKKLLPRFQSEVDKAVKKRVIKKNTGARYKSRIFAKIRSEKVK